MFSWALAGKGGNAATIATISGKPLQRLALHRSDSAATVPLRSLRSLALGMWLAPFDQHCRGEQDIFGLAARFLIDPDAPVIFEQVNGGIELGAHS